MPTTLASHVGEQLRWEQLMAVVGEEGVHRPRWDQVTTPGRRVQLVIGWVACQRHAGQSARWQPPARTTGSTRPTRSPEPRPFSRHLPVDLPNYPELLLRCGASLAGELLQRLAHCVRGLNTARSAALADRAAFQGDDRAVKAGPVGGVAAVAALQNRCPLSSLLSYCTFAIAGSYRPAPNRSIHGG